MKKAQLLSYGVMVGVSVCLAESLRSNSLWRDALIGMAFGLVAGLYEWHRSAMRSRCQQKIAESSNSIRNNLQVIAYASYIQPHEPLQVALDAIEGIRQELATGLVEAAGIAQHRDCNCPAAYPQPPKRQPEPAAKAQHTGTSS